MAYCFSVDVGTVDSTQSRRVERIEGWERRKITMPFRAGGVALAKIEVDVALMTDSSIGLSPTVGTQFPCDVMRKLGTDVAVIHSCPIDGKQPRVSFSKSGIRYLPAEFPHHHLELSGDFDSYLKRQFRSKSRSTLVRKVNKMVKRSGGELDIREYSQPDEIETWYRLAREVSKNTYQERLLKNGLPDLPEYLPSVIEAAGRGGFRGYLLFHDDKAIAYLACPITENGIIIYDYVGHDPDQNNLSPGTVLLYKVLERAFADDTTKIFDFTAGDGAHKVRYATHTTTCADTWFFRPYPKYLAMVAAHVTLKNTQDLAMAGLERFEVKDQVKRFVRNFRS